MSALLPTPALDALPAAGTLAALPTAGTLERWALDYICTVDLGEKLSPQPAPRALERDAPVRKISEPGRPVSLAKRGRPRKTPSAEALRSPARRAELMHTFWHHELQAAELFCWAILAFPHAPPAFRRGLARIAIEETRHMRLYTAYLASLDYAIGAFPVHDWFWERIPSAADPASFVAVMGLGFEAANLDHTARFAERFRTAGDVAGAELIERVGLEELAHVRFARRWFAHFTAAASRTIDGASRTIDVAAPRDDVRHAAIDFATWRAALPAPLSPLVFRGKPIARNARLRAGLDARFVDALEAWTPEW